MMTTRHGKPRPHSQAREVSDLIQLVAWKLRVWWRQTRDAHGGGYRRLERRARRWADQWRARYGADPGACRRWLLRPQGGVFWFPVAQAVDWARAQCTPKDLEAAEAAAAGVFNVLGSGPVAVGATPTWRRDLYSGREWPATAAPRLKLLRGDGSDIRTVWEMSRCYHFLPLARAYWRTGEDRYRDCFVRHVTSWIAHNPPGYGPNWASPMELGLRAANWVLALVLFAEAEGTPAAFWEGMLANLFATGRYVERYLEWHPVYRGNHYVANGLGLIYLGALFRDVPDGERWLHLGADILTSEILRQVGRDGASFEGALGYHRLATELFSYGGELLRRNLPGALPPAYEERLRRMYGFIAAYLPSTGEAPMLGDADDGRLHALSAEAFAAPRRHALGLPEAHWPVATPGSTAFPQGGFYVLRSRDDHLVVRCGAVGLGGAGSHDHNDQLSFELTLGGRRVVADSGTYTYTRDLDARYAFRSTAAHSAVQVGDEEQNPILVEKPWRILADRTRAECVRWELTAHCHLFEGQHFGYAHRASGAVCRRRIRVRLPEGCWEVVDEIDGVGVEWLTWRLHLAPTDVRRLPDDESAYAILLPGRPTVRITISAPPAGEFLVGESAASDRYGVRYARPCLIVRGRVSLPCRLTTRFTVGDD